MKSMASLFLLLLMLMASIYLIAVGSIGAAYGEPLGYLFLILGLSLGIPLIQGYRSASI